MSVIVVPGVWVVKCVCCARGGGVVGGAEVDLLIRGCK